MEFSLFLLFLTILVSLLYYAGMKVLGLAGKKRWFRLVLPVLPVALFPFTRVGAAAALVVVLAFLAVKETGFPRKKRTLVLELFFLAVLAFAGYFYNREIREIWTAVDRLKEGWLDALPFLKNSRLGDVFSVIQYFRFAYPVLAVFLVFFLVDRELGGKPKTYWYRFFRKFDHKAVVPLVIFWTVYLAADRIRPGWFGQVWQTLTLELAVFCSLVYTVHGLLTVQVLFRRLGRIRVPFLWTLAVLYVLVVASGPGFVFALTLLMGIGVSDIWMHYRKGKARVAGRE